MNWILSQIPMSFLIGAVAGPIAMFLFQNIKKIGGWIDSQPTWAKQAWLFVLTQLMAVVATLTQSDISCSGLPDATSCLALLTPSILKGLVTQGAATIAYKLKQSPPMPSGSGGSSSSGGSKKQNPQ